MKVNSVNLLEKKVFCNSDKNNIGPKSMHFRENDSFLLSQIYYNTNDSVDFNKAKSYNMKKFSEFVIGVGLIGVAALVAFKSKSIRKAATVVEDGLDNMGVYRESLARGLSEYTDKKVNAQKLSCVADKKEFIDIISELRQENYVCTPENMEKGIFIADLHSHSNFSDGKGNVRDLLDEAAKYGDSLFAKTKNKFVFALTDHDGVEGIKEALSIISDNPDKFKNIKFVPGAELSYAIKATKTSNPTETVEILAYCINPFDKKTASYFNKLHEKRRNTITESIDKMNQMFPDTKFSAEEFSKTYKTDLNHDMFQANLHWKINHYGQTKYAITKFAQQTGKNLDFLYSDIMSKTNRGKALGNLKDENLIPNYFNENAEITALRKKIQPKIISDNLIKAQSESTIEEISDAFANDQNTVFAVAHPYYILERRDNPAEHIKVVKDKLNGRLIGTESYHQAYNDFIPRNDIAHVNNELENMDLIAIGGRDNHNACLFK